MKLINHGYNTISNIETSQTTINVFKSAASRTLGNFFKNNWRKLLIGLVITIVILIIFKTTLKRFIINRKKRFLKLRKDSLNNLIRGAQSQYFKENNISDMQYKTRLNKFEEMIRDINRQLPLLDEKISEIGYKKKIKTLKKSKRKKKRRAPSRLSYLLNLFR